MSSKNGFVVLNQHGDYIGFVTKDTCIPSGVFTFPAVITWELEPRKMSDYQQLDHLLLSVTKRLKEAGHYKLCQKVQKDVDFLNINVEDKCQLQVKMAYLQGIQSTLDEIDELTAKIRQGYEELKTNKFV